MYIKCLCFTCIYDLSFLRRLKSHQQKINGVSTRHFELSFAVGNTKNKTCSFKKNDVSVDICIIIHLVHHIYTRMLIYSVD